MHRGLRVRGRVARRHKMARDSGAEVAALRRGAFGGHVDSPPANEAQALTPSPPGCRGQSMGVIRDAEERILKPCPQNTAFDVGKSEPGLGETPSEPFGSHPR